VDRVQESGFEIDHAIMTSGHIIFLAMGALAVFGVTTSTVYSLMVAWGALRFRRAVAAAAGPHTFLPPVRAARL